MGRMMTASEKSRFSELLETRSFTKKEMAKLFNITLSVVEKRAPAGYVFVSGDPRANQEPVTSEDYCKVKNVYLDLKKRGVKITFANLALYSKVRRNNAIRCVERLSCGELVMKCFEDIN